MCSVETVAPEDSAVGEANCKREDGRHGVSLVARGGDRSTAL